jgi:hypothetical protein
MHRWDAWVLARMTRRVWRFGRLYVEKDEIVLADPEPTIESLRKIYSNRVNVELYVAIADVELIT